MVVRGQDNYGNFELLPPPIDEEAVTIEAHTEIVNRIRSGIMTPAKK
jgi:hypothetical protein